MRLRSVEICAGAGGQAIGLEQAGFHHEALVEIDRHACETLRRNRPAWNVLQMPVERFDPADVAGVELLAGGVPCPPFSMGGKRLGPEDERDLFPEVIRLVREIHPAAVMIENVRGLLTARFADYRAGILAALAAMGYWTDWKLLRASDFGVPQVRERSILVALDPERCGPFEWPSPGSGAPPTVGEALGDLMGSCGWEGAAAWAEAAASPAPTLSGGSRKHGGADLGPTRSKRIWAGMGVDAVGVADSPPSPDFTGVPRLTVRMAARIQGFPDDWEFAGGKTAAYRQVGNAFPPPVARAMGQQIARSLRAGGRSKRGA